MLTSIYKRKGRPGFTLEWHKPGMIRPKQKTFRTKAAAIAYRDELRGAAGKPAPKVASDILFVDYAARWLRATKTAVREGTGRGYDTIIRNHLNEAFPGKLSDITRAQVRDLVVRLRERGLKKSTIGHIRGTLHAILEAGMEDEILTSNAARYRGRSKLMSLGPTAGERRGAIKAFEVDQLRAFLAAAETAAPRHAMLFRTMVATGLRPGEAVALQPEDLDYAKGRIRIARAITRGRIQPCKTTAQGEFHYVDMPTELAEELKTWEAACLGEALAAGLPRPQWLFPATTGSPRRRILEGHLDETSRLSRAFKRTLMKAGLPLHFSPHCLRHTYATHQLAAGESIYYVQRQLRHADIRMTVGTYGSWLPAGNRAAADRHFTRLLGSPRQRARQKS
jgi:integrase